MRGLRVALSGRIEGENRARFRERVESAGATYAAALDDDVDVLVLGEESVPSKVARAEELGVRVVPWARFQQELASRPTPPSTELGPASVHTALKRAGSTLRVADRRVPLRTHPLDEVGERLVPDRALFALRARHRIRGFKRFNTRR